MLKKFYIFFQKITLIFLRFKILIKTNAHKNFYEIKIESLNYFSENELFIFQGEKHNLINFYCIK